MSQKQLLKKGGKNIPGYIIMYIAVLAILLPFVNVILCCFKTNEEINRVDLLPTSLNLDNFKTVFSNSSVFTGFLNSIVITGAALVLSVLICSLAGYSISRQEGTFFKFLYFFFLSAMMIPAATTLVPVYTMMQSLHLIDSPLSLIIMYSAGAVGTGILLYTGFIKGIPRELEEAACIDGCGYLQRFFSVVLPLLKPVSITYAVLNSISVWNDFLYPLLFISAKSKQPITLLVYTFRNERGSDWGAIYALLVIAALPPVLFYFLMQKYFDEGMTAGAVKG